MLAWQERTCLLVGEEKLEAFRAATVIIVGTGGVGGYAAEMICRAGVGNMVLIDSDTVSVSNINRQLLAMTSTIGKSKVRVLEARLKDINPDVNITVIEQYLTPENIPTLLTPIVEAAAGIKAASPEGTGPGRAVITPLGVGEAGGLKGACVCQNLFLVDAIDTLAPKLALIDFCVKNGIGHVSSMGSGAKFDVTQVRIADISKSYNCPLAYIVRKRLRREYGISKGFKVVFSEELPDKDAIIAEEGRNKKSNVGTISYLPAVFGCACAQVAVSFLMENA